VVAKVKSHDKQKKETDALIEALHKTKEASIGKKPGLLLLLLLCFFALPDPPSLPSLPSESNPKSADLKRQYADSLAAIKKQQQ